MDQRGGGDGNKVYRVGMYNKQVYNTHHKIHPTESERITVCGYHRGQQLPLCQWHYMQVYRIAHGEQIDSRRRCQMCRCIAHGVPRHCPDTKVVNRYYNNACLDITISSGDYLLQFSPKVVHQSEEISTDEELDELIETMTLPELELGEHTDNILEGVKSTVIKIGSVLKGRACCTQMRTDSSFLQLAIVSSGADLGFRKGGFQNVRA